MEQLIKAITVKLSNLDGNDAIVNAKKLLRYVEAFDLENDLDIPYKSWVVQRIGESSEANTFVGLFDTLPLLEAVPEEDIPVGGYAFVGLAGDRKIYYWNEDLEEWYNPFGLTAIRTTVFSADAGASDVFTLEFAPDGIIEVNVGDVEVYPVDYDYVGADITVTYPFTGGESVKVVYFRSIVTGQRGAEGKSAYEVAVEDGFVGTESEWLESLKGADGTSVTILGTLANEGELPPTGSEGDAYMIGSDLYVWNPILEDWQNVGQIKGDTGADGKSAYQVWLDLGNVGTEADFIADLKGTQGLSAYEIAQLEGFEGTVTEWLDSLKGADGVIDFSTADLRYLRKDIDDATTHKLSLGKLALTDTEVGAFTYVLGVDEEGEGVLVEPSSVIGDKGIKMLVEAPSAIWTLNHGLNKFVGFLAKDSAGNPLYPTWEHTSLNQLVLTNASPVAGEVVMF